MGVFNDLTDTERTVLNNLSIVHNSDVKLGDEIQTVIDQVQANGTPEASKAEEGTPVNAAAATGVINITGVSIHGENVVIGNEVYEFNASDGLTPSDPAFTVVDITARVVKATNNLTLAAQPTSGDTMTIGEKVYIFVPNTTDDGDGQVTVGTSLATAKAAVIAAINGTDGHNDPHPLVTAGEFTGDVLPITAIIGGTAGNSIGTTETFTAETNVFSDTTLKTGANCSAANTVTDLATSIEANSYLVSAVAGSGKIDLTAAILGASGNAIVLSKSMANGNVNGKDHLEGGVDGTVGDKGKIFFDASYLYVAVDDNTEVDQNWRRISVGSAF